MSTGLKFTAGNTTRLSIDGSTGLCTVANALQVNQDATSLGIFKSQGATPEFRLVDAGGVPAAGLAFTDATNLTELYCSDNLEIGPGGNTTINAGIGSFAFKNGGTDNFTVSGGGNTMRQNAPSGLQVFEMNTAAISQQSGIKFTYGTPGSGTAGFELYRPVNSRSLSFYNYANAKNQMTLDSCGNILFQDGATTLGAFIPSATVPTFAVYNTVNNAEAAKVHLFKTRGGSTTTSGTELGDITVFGRNVATDAQGARIVFTQTGTVSGNSAPTSISFRTSETSAINQERFVIPSTGPIQIRNIANSYGGLQLESTTVNENAIFIKAPNTTANTAGWFVGNSTGWGGANSSFLIGNVAAGASVAASQFSISTGGNASIGTAPGSRRLTIQHTGGITGFIQWYNSTNAVPYVGCGYDQFTDGFAFWNNDGSSDLNARVMYVNRAVSMTTTWNVAAATLYVGRATSTSRSINAAGTVNASGADYAEYLEKDVHDEVIAKGDIVGIKSNGKLTKKWSEAKSFLIKSTIPSYVGGDGWSLCIGPRPERPTSEDPAVIAKFEADLAEWQDKLEAERVKMDRMAYSGQVPVNVIGAVAGDYIVAVEGADDSITGIAVPEADISFSQYKKAVGRVIKVLEDGRAQVNVIVH